MGYKVAVLGVGALGKRHLSSILESKLPMEVYCYDVNVNALDSFSWVDTYQNKNLVFVDTMNKMPKEIDVAVFAMTSIGRRQAFDELVGTSNVKNIVFEKVLFQKLEDYEHVQMVLLKKNIKAWVNCARRQMDGYQSLKKELESEQYMEIHIFGGEWGLACNSIHFLDLIEFLSGADNTTVNNVFFDDKIVESKRNGFKEVYGVILGESGKCKTFSITCTADSVVPVNIEIVTEHGKYMIEESKQRIHRSMGGADWKESSEPFLIPYQSQMTKFVIEDILLHQTSRLTSFRDSKRLHLQMVSYLIDFFEKHGMEKGVCPIT